MQSLRQTLLLIALLWVDVSALGQGNSLYAWKNFTGQPGGTGNADGTGSTARFANPSGVAVNGAGNLYVADTYSHTIRRVTKAGTVTTLAGSPNQPGSADGAGSNARFSYPSGVAVDSAGNVYVADTFNNTVRKVTSTGVVTTLAGNPGQEGSADGTGIAASFSGPRGVAVDSAGNIYVADSGNCTIRKVTTNGTVTTLAGSVGQEGSSNGTGSSAQFYYPYGVAVDGAGNVYVADLDNECIRKVTSAGVVTTLAGTAIRQALAGGVVISVTGSADGTGGAAQFFSPSGVAVDGAGNVYVTDSGNCTIRKVTSGGVVTTLVGSAGQSGSANGVGSNARFNNPIGVAVDTNGNVFVADSDNNTLREVTTSGQVTTLAGSPGQSGSADAAGSAARFNFPYSIAADQTGNLYVADTFNNTIRKLSSIGMVTTLAGSAGQAGSADGIGVAAQFSSPSGLTMDKAGNIYVADFGNSTIRKVMTNGLVTTLAGSAGQTGCADGANNGARFNGPFGVAVDGVGKVYVSDAYNSTIRMVTSTGVVTTLAGSPGQLGNADGTGSSAEFYYPAGVAVDGARNVYVADAYNNTIRKVTTNGVVTTVAGTAGEADSIDGTGAAARFNGPFGLAVDSAGNVYIADAYNSAIRMLTSDGVVTTLAGTPGQSGSSDGTGIGVQFFFPYGVAVDGAGGVYVADSGNSTLRKMTPNGVVTTIAGSAGQIGSLDVALGDARFNGPSGVALDGLGNLYVADADNNAIRKVTSAGVVTTIAGSPGQSDSANGMGGSAQFSHPSSVAVDSCGNLYVSDTYNSRIQKVTSNGLVTTLAGSPGQPGSADGMGSAALFSSPSGLAVDGASNVYVADFGNSTIRKITTGGVVMTVAGKAGQFGSADGVGNLALFNGPNGVAVDGTGNIYVADSGNSTIRKVSNIGVVTTLAGSAGQSGWVDGVGNAARFDYPYNLALDGTGNLYVTDSGNSTIRKITSAGMVETIGGLADVIGGADGIGATANFDAPSGIAADSVGRLYVADAGNNRISQGTPLLFLNIGASDAGIEVWWPSAFAGFALQQNLDAGNANGWSSAGYNIHDDGTNKSVTFPPTNVNVFFRLIAN